MEALYGTLPLFYEVAKLKSFTKAAQRLEIGVSTLSRRDGDLEKQMGVQLFLRNTRNVTLTTVGCMLFERCEFILSEAGDAYEVMHQDFTSLQGQIRLSIHPDIYHDYLATALTDFAGKWPAIRLKIIISERAPDPTLSPCDADIRFEAPAGSSLIIRRLLMGSPRLYAAPDFFRNRPWPQTPHDIRKLPCIHIQGKKPVWNLSRDNEKVEIVIQASYIFNSMRLCHDFTLAGLGLSFLFPASVATHVKSGRLKQVLPQWCGPASEVYIALENRQVPNRVRLLTKYIEDVFAALRQEETI